MGKIIVIGHENPDTDNIAAAIGMADFLRMAGKETVVCKKGNFNKETDWALDRSGLKNRVQDLAAENLPEGQEVFLVDFNEEGQSPVDPAKVKLSGLIDHHKLGGCWKTEEPVLFRIEPLGSSSTLVCKMYQENKLDFPPEVAKMLLCGIISDTLKLTSPTTTDEDKVWVSILAKQTGENIEELAESLFNAKSDLSEFSPEQIARLDYKTFDFSGKKTGIGVIETVKPENAKKLEEELKSVMRNMKNEEGLDFIFLGIVDIINNQTEILLINEESKNLIMKSFSDLVIQDDNLILKGVVSRKKQIVPALERVLKS